VDVTGTRSRAFGAAGHNALERMRGGLVVSVQAGADSPLAAPEHLAAMARAVEVGGAVGIRTEGVAAVTAIREAVAVPVIGLVKRAVSGSDVYITPDRDDALAVAEAGADLVAVDATNRARPDGRSGPEFVAALAADLPGRIVADVDVLSAGVAAAEAGAAAVATTLAGYASGTGGLRVPGPAATAGRLRVPGPAANDAESLVPPDIALVADLAAELDVAVLAEGRLATVADVRAAFAAGAFAVVVGTAITDPGALTRRLAAATPKVADG
jgi:N-acylglucosamine-6-phosphate 2-epimerase